MGAAWRAGIHIVVTIEFYSSGRIREAKERSVVFLRRWCCSIVRDTLA